MDWTKSYGAEWRLYKVKPETWADDGIMPNVLSASITRTADGALIESGSIDTLDALDDGYYRIAMIAKQYDDVERVDVGTFLVTAEDGTINYGVDHVSNSCLSVLYPASTTAIMDGDYAPAGVDGVSYAAEMLRSAINAPVETEGGFTLNDNVVHELGSMTLDAVWAVLSAGGYCIQIDGRGIVHLVPLPSVPSLHVGDTDLGMLVPGIKHTMDTSDLPNRYIIIDGLHRTVAINDDPNSPISTVARGYAVDEVDTSPVPIDGETLAAYAVRKLHEASHMYDERTYTRVYAPAVYPYSLIRASVDGLEGDYRVKVQSIDCSHGVTISEKSAREVNLWT